MAENKSAKGGSMSCPCCSGKELEFVYSVTDIPVHSSILLETAGQAINFPRRDLELRFCRDCGFIFNVLFDESAQDYGSDFEESQHYSGTFDNFATELMQEIIAACDLNGKKVLEIGCGRGEFLQGVCRLGNCEGIGIDPGFREARTNNHAANNVHFIKDYFGPDYADLQADLVLCRHTLEHISTTAGFVRDIRNMLGENENAVVFFETPDVRRVLEEGAFWDIYYEHCSYFSAGSHARLFRREKFSVEKLALVYEGQYIVQYAHPTSHRTAACMDVETDLESMCGLAGNFSKRAGEKREYWRRQLESAKNQDKSIAVWGGGSKAVAFLTTLTNGNLVDQVVDINPHKQGKYLPGSGHKIIAPSMLMECKPDLVLVMNPIYLAEIRESLDAFGLGPELLAVT